MTWREKTKMWLCSCLPIVRLCPADPVKGVRFASMNCSA